MDRKRIGRALVEAWYDYTPDRFDPASIRTAVIFIPKSIGDGMGLYPVIRALQIHGVAWLGIVASSRSAPIYTALQSASLEVFDIPRDRDYKAVRATARQIRQAHGRIDLCIDGTALATSPATYFVGTLRARMNLQLSGSRMRAYAALCNPLAAHYYQASPPENWARLMLHAGIAEVAPRFELPIPDAVAGEMRDWLTPIGPYVAFNLDGSIDKRRLPQDKAAELIEAIHQQLGLPIVIPHDPQGRDKALALSERYDFVHAYPAPGSILHSAAIIAGAELLISPNTAAIHIASAYDRPTLALYHKIDPVWRPQASQHQVLIVDGPLATLSQPALLSALATLTSAIGRDALTTLPQ